MRAGPKRMRWTLVFTGQVVPITGVVDCLGTCINGRCDGRCPQQGDQITFVGEDATGQVLIHNESDGRAYECAADLADEHGANLDCAHVPAGHTGFIAGRSVSDQQCTGAAFGAISVVIDRVPTPSGLDTCGYQMCDIHLTPSCTSN